MDIALKHQIAEKILQSNDDTLLNEIKSLVGLSEKDFWDELPSEVKFAINEAQEQLNRGEGKPHSQVMKEIQNRFLKK